MKYQVIFYDDYSDVPYTLQTFNSKSDAENWAESHEYDYEDEVYDPVTQDYKFEKIYKYHNPEDKESYKGYEVKTINESKMENKLHESLRKLIQQEIKSVMNEGPEEMGAYRRLVITTPSMEKIKTEFTKFMARPEVKSLYPVRFKMIDSPKPDTFVVDVEGDKATVVAIKLSDLAKKLDKSVSIMVRKERKLK